MAATELEQRQEYAITMLLAQRDDALNRVVYVSVELEITRAALRVAQTTLARYDVVQETVQSKHAHVCPSSPHGADVPCKENA